MRFETCCKSCLERIEFSYDVSDRGELNFEVGNKIELSCRKCFSKRYYHPNSIYAKIRRTVVCIALLVSIASTVLISMFFLKFYNENKLYIYNNWDLELVKEAIVLILIPIIFFGLIIINENKKVKRFNSYRIKD